MKKVVLINQYQKDLIHEKEFAPDSYFNVEEDADGNYFIGIEERMACNNQYSWVKDLPLIDYNPKPDPLI